MDLHHRFEYLHRGSPVPWVRAFGLAPPNGRAEKDNCYDGFRLSPTVSFNPEFAPSINSYDADWHGRLIAVTILRLNYLTIGFRSSNPTLDGVPASLVSQIELGWSLISATVPCINPFMRAVSTSYGALQSDTIMGGDHVSNLRKPSGTGSSYGLRSMISRKRALNSKQSGKSTTSAHSDRRESAAQDIIHADGKDHESIPKSPRIYRGDQSSNMAQVFSKGRVDTESIGGESNDSTKMIIKKEVQWVVESDKNTVSTAHTGAPSVEMTDQNNKVSSEL